jgi:hypothetical protein
VQAPQAPPEQTWPAAHCELAVHVWQVPATHTCGAVQSLVAVQGTHEVAMHASPFVQSALVVQPDPQTPPGLQTCPLGHCDVAVQGPQTPMLHP